MQWPGSNNQSHKSTCFLISVWYVGWEKASIIMDAILMSQAYFSILHLSLVKSGWQ